MATTICMPEVLTGVTEAAIATWLVAIGQQVEVGTPLAEIETDKAVVEYASETAGTVLELLVAEGVGVAIGDAIVVVGAAGEEVRESGETPDAALAPVTGDEPASPQAGDEPPVPDAAPTRTAPAPVPTTDAAAPAPVPTTDAAAPAAVPPVRRFVSPLVRRLARERGIDLASITGTGPNGRIVRRDIDGVDAATSAAAYSATDALPAAQAEASGPVGRSEEYNEIPLTGMRRAIARRLTESKTTVPHFYLVADCRVDRLIELRREVNEASSVRISVNDFVLKAVAGALRAVPDANVTWGESAIRRHRDVDIAVAVAIDGGLVTPVVRGADRLSLSEISTVVVDLAERARAGRLKQHELEGGSFAVSNLGMYGTKEFSAIINPPQAGILAVGAARKTAVVDADGGLAVGTVMTVTLSADHRVLDGAVAAEWLAAFTRGIEHPLSLLI
ncbi:dihydrolipoamide acetyltransferase family protein [Microbacterium caowuchunii]|uniref:Dihydrolipoamide acetyltransferase component of pyruvate dehydrogenase complex n=1 Tax=Microbacterium caowuchunii TaxID=2614638 RepID=A0A5N0TF17_9MICO|nr:dihydrolipoamide acetyltransferase family protein [Microbacterium caowuchunii]KAA9133620.1 2-oxo acid dehydrogenase subunit E2 [Microbacterium caowuchunii]